MSEVHFKNIFIQTRANCSLEKTLFTVSKSVDLLMILICSKHQNFINFALIFRVFSPFTAVLLQKYCLYKKIQKNWWKSFSTKTQFIENTTIFTVISYIYTHSIYTHTHTHAHACARTHQKLGQYVRQAGQVQYRAIDNLSGCHYININ